MQKTENDNFEEYNDPALYDEENNSYLADFPFLLKWAEETKGTIIELACGTGRVTIPLAGKGHKLISVDIHKGMLDEGRKKSTEELKIDWVEQDCTRLNLGISSQLIYMVGNSFQHFLKNEEQDRLLTSVRKHLESDGIFIFNMRFPSVDELLQPSTEEYWRSYRDSRSKQEVKVYTISNFDTLNQIQHYTTIRRYLDREERVVNEVKTSIRLRYTFPKEMERLLSSHGFEIVNVYKNWNKDAITNDSYEMVYVCRKKD